MKSKTYSKNMEMELKEILGSHSFRITKPRLEILKVLKTCSKPVTIPEIQEKLGDSTIDQATIYRTINSFLKRKLLAEHNFNDNINRFELVIDRHHHHHVVCKKCGRIENIEACYSGKIEKELQERGYRDISHSMEFFGVCEKCREN